MVEIWTYLRSAVKSMELTGYKDQGLYCPVRMLQINVIGGEIKSIMSKIDSLGDQAASSGDKFQAETAYRRLIDAWDRLEDPGFMCINPLLTKISEFYAKNNEPFQAKKILRRLFEDTSTPLAGYDSRRLLANSYQEMSCQIAEIFESLSLDETTFSSKTPCPAFHFAIQDQVPEDILNIMSESGNTQDILLRGNIHVAIEAGRDALIDNIIKCRSGLGLNVDDRDAFRRTPLHLATQLKRCTAFDALVIAGADRTARDATGRTILETASRSGSSKMVIALLDDRINDASADVNDRVFYNTSTPLQAAAEEGHGEIVDILLGHGAKVSKVRQYDGKTAAQLAWERGHTDIADRINRLMPRDTVDPMLCSFGLDEYVHNRAEMDIL
jgi:ankyrin repeat protein